MNTFHTVLIWIHIVAGTIAITTFWIPTLTKKGSNIHKRVGTWYTNAMYVVAFTALSAAMIRLFTPLSLVDPAIANNADDVAKFVRRSQLMGTFLTVLAFLVLANIRHGILALRAKEQRQSLRRLSHLGLLAILGIVGAIGLVIGLQKQFILLQIFSPLALLNSIAMFRYSFKAQLKRSEWIIEHLNNLLAAGIATHTAVLVLGAAKLVNSVMPVSLSLLPWIAPAIIGVVANYLWTRVYQQRLGHNNPTVSQSPISIERAKI